MLRVTLRVGQRLLGDYEIRRITNTTQVEQEPDEVNTYLVSRIPDLAAVGQIEHRYGDGAHALAAAALTLAATTPLPALPETPSLSPAGRRALAILAADL